MLKKIIIIGAGISGLVAGILLKRHGFEVKIFEKKAEVKPIGGGLGIWPNASKILLNLPCGKKIRSLTGTPKFEYMSNAQGETLSTVPRDLFLSVNGYPILNVCRAELHQILLDEFDRSDVIFNANCIGLEQDEKTATAFFSNHTQESAELIIGADGGFSKVRQHIFPDVQLEYSGYIHLISILKFPKQQFPKHNFIFGANHFYITLPISDQRHLLFQVRQFSHGKLRTEFLQPQQQINLFRHWSDEVDHTLDILESQLSHKEYRQHYYCNETYELPALPQWFHNRIVLIGDAAHLIGPILALGSALGLEDCVSLTTALTTEKYLHQALNRYQSQQKIRYQTFHQLEHDRKNLLISRNENDYYQYTQFLKTTSPEIICQPILDALKVL